jgi:hypothetical protein
MASVQRTADARLPKTAGRPGDNPGVSPCLRSTTLGLSPSASLVARLRWWLVPRSCTICTHPDREAIDEALVGGVAFPALVAEYRVSKDALSRHKANHLPAKLVMAQAAEEVAQADDLLDQVRDLQARTLAILEAAESTRQHRTALSAIREARSNLELLAKLLGELDERPVVNLNVSPEWLELRAVIVGALEPYSDARGAVLSAIEGVSNGHASG